MLLPSSLPPTHPPTRSYPYNINWNYGLLPQTWEDPAHKNAECDAAVSVAGCTGRRGGCCCAGRGWGTHMCRLTRTPNRDAAVSGIGGGLECMCLVAAGRRVCHGGELSGQGAGNGVGWGWGAPDCFVFFVLLGLLHGMSHARVRLDHTSR